MQFRLHLHMHGRSRLKSLDPIRCPRSGTNRHWGPLRGPASALGYGGDLIITWFRYLPSKIGLPGRLGGLFTGGTGEFVVHGDAAPAVAPPRRPARCPGLHTCAGQSASDAAGRVVLLAKTLHAYSVQSLRDHELPSARYPVRVSRREDLRAER